MTITSRPGTLRSRIVTLFVVLMLVVQMTGFMLINTVGVDAAHDEARESLAAGARVFERMLALDRARLAARAERVAADGDVRKAMATSDAKALAAMVVLEARRADEGTVVIAGGGSRVSIASTDAWSGQRFALPQLLSPLESAPASSGLVLVDGRLHEVAIAALDPRAAGAAWIALVRPFTAARVRDLKQLTGVDISFVARTAREPWRMQATTLGDDDTATLLRELSTGLLHASGGGGDQATLDDAPVRLVTLDSPPDTIIVAVLSGGLDVEPFRRMERKLALVTLLGVIASVLASVLIANRITRPVRALAGVARGLVGDEETSTPLGERDEIGELEKAFHSLQKGMAMWESRTMEFALRDALTELPNRVVYNEHLRLAIEAAERDGGTLAVLIMDLDHFRYVNDTLGHPIGDQLLREVAARLKSIVRRETDTVARLGGDEFAIVMRGAAGNDARRVARSITAALETPMRLEGNVIDVRASIGIACFPDDGRDAPILMRRADVAMYEAKRNHSGTVVWSSRYDVESQERLSLLGDLRHAVDRDELTLVYQPKLSLAAPAACQAEALVRWNHPSRGLVPPADFIPLAEQLGYVRHITRWVMAHAIGQCVAWRRAGIAVTLSINISARDVMDDELPDRFAELLARHGCPGDWIVLEITESALIDRPQDAIANLQRLHATGCRLSIDDFGTGYSSLAYLRRLPLHEIKIDKSFVLNMVRDAGDAVIVRSTIELAHNMGLTVVAEGVEDAETLAKLRDLGCDVAQGFLIARPLSAEDFAAWALQAACRPRVECEEAVATT